MADTILDRASEHGNWKTMNGIVAHVERSENNLTDVDDDHNVQISCALNVLRMAITAELKSPHYMGSIGSPSSHERNGTYTSSVSRAQHSAVHSVEFGLEWNVPRQHLPGQFFPYFRTSKMRHRINISEEVCTTRGKDKTDGAMGRDDAPRRALGSGESIVHRPRSFLPAMPPFRTASWLKSRRLQHLPCSIPRQSCQTLGLYPPVTASATSKMKSADYDLGSVLKPFVSR